VKSDKHILFLNNAAGIWAHTASDAILLNRLARQGVKVSTISCDGYVGGLCTVRRSRNRTSSDILNNGQIDCADCKFSAHLTSSAGLTPKTNKFWLGEFLTTKEREDAMEFVSSWMTSGCPLEAEYHGVPIARLAGYEVSLTYKSWQEATEGAGREEYFQAAQDAALTVVSAMSFFTKWENFDALIVRSPHYYNNGAFASVAKDRGLRVIFLDGSPNLSEDYTNLMMWDWGKFQSGNPAKQFFEPELVDVDQFAEERISRHFKALEHGASHKVYSSARSSGQSPLQVLGADVDKTTAIVALSSVDESVSALMAKVNPLIRYPGSVFQDQFDWVRETIEWFRENPHLQLVVRVHPREFPNKRESKTSPAGIRWVQELSELPPNVFLNHPNQELSLYDFLDEVDVLVTGWSSVGLEAALQGVKLITYDSTLPGYPASIGLTGTSKQEYFDNLDTALRGATEIPFRDNALKWMHLLMNIGTTRVGGRFLASRRNLMPRWANLILEGLDRYLYFIYRPLDLWRGILFEPTDRKFERVILEGKSNLYE